MQRKREAAKNTLPTTLNEEKSSRKTDLDNSDRRLLIAKEQDPFASARVLAEQVGMTPSPVIERLRWLKEHGYIDEQRASVVNPPKVGFDIEVLMDITLESTPRKDAVIEELTKIPYVRRCWFVTGNSDFVAQIFARNIEDLKTTITTISNIKGIMRTRTNIVLERPINRSKLPLQQLPDFAEATTTRRQTKSKKGQARRSRR